MPQKLFITTKTHHKMQKLLSIDWLTLNLKGQPQANNITELVQQEYGTRQFKAVFKVKMHGQEVGTLVAYPYLPALPKDFMQFKLANYLLYTDTAQQLISNLCATLNWHILGVSRIDICLDFHTFKRGLAPETFLKRFASNQYYTMSKSTFQLMGNKSDENIYNYLSIGARKSDVRTILYNKTKEMQDVKSKPWIEDCWKKAGIDPNKDVWRLEFSLKGEAKSFALKESGDMIEVKYENIFDEKFLTMLFQVLFSRYFRFIKATSKTNHYREQALDLLDMEYVRTCRIISHDRQEVDRSLRIFANRLVKEFNEDKRQDVQDRLVHGMYITTWLLHNRLLSYTQKRGSVVKV